MSIVIQNNFGCTKVFRNLNNVEIRGGRVFVDGKPIEELDAPQNEKNITINITGDVERLKVDYCGDVNIQGNAGRVETHGGNVKVKCDVLGDVETHGGNVNCMAIGGDCTVHGGNIYKS